MRPEIPRIEISEETFNSGGNLLLGASCQKCESCAECLRRLFIQSKFYSLCFSTCFLYTVFGWVFFFKGLQSWITTARKLADGITAEWGSRVKDETLSSQIIIGGGISWKSCVY